MKLPITDSVTSDSDVCRWAPHIDILEDVLAFRPVVFFLFKIDLLENILPYINV